MLVSNYEDAQAEAQAAGALPGFGKADLRHGAVPALEAVCRLARGRWDSGAGTRLSADLPCGPSRAFPIAVPGCAASKLRNCSVRSIQGEPAAIGDR